MDLNVNFCGLEDDYENYIKSIQEKQLLNFKYQFKFSKELIKNISKENEINDDIYINKLLRYPINEFKYEINKNDNDKILLENNIIKYDSINKLEIKKFIKSKRKKTRRSKKFINSKLEIYLEKKPGKWKKNYIKKLSMKTNLPIKTIYKWNWNKLKQI